MCWALTTHLSSWRPFAKSGLSVSNPSVLCRASLLPTGSLLSLCRSKLNNRSCQLDESLYLCVNVYSTVSCLPFHFYNCLVESVCWQMFLWGIRCLCYLLWCCPAIRSPWNGGNFNPEHQRQNKATDFDLPLAKKKPCNFPLQCHHAGNIGLKTPSFLLLSTHVWPEVWMRSVRDAAPYCTKEMQSEGGTEKKQFWHIFFSATVRQFSTAGLQFHEGIRARRDAVCWWSTFWHLCCNPPVYMKVEPSML